MNTLFNDRGLLTVILLFLSVLIIAQKKYPSWSYEMKIWPFDILYPFETSFARINKETETSDTEIIERLNIAKNKGANVVIVYIDDEQSYETFVDENGFNRTINRIHFLVDEAHFRGLKVICYLNGLEVISVGATTNQSMPSMARNYSAWLQIDITGKKMAWYTNSQIGWIPENSEDAWVSPLSPYRDLFKNRIAALSAIGMDGVYIDATFLPGVDFYGIKWASKDSYFQNAFFNKYNVAIPSQVDWNSENWRKFIYFRHEVIRDYLNELADFARSLSLTPFFESSSCDFKNGTFLGNDVPFTISGNIACSPEIEPEGDFLTAFRMSKSTRDANQDFPMWFLGWPESSDQARREFAITLCHSGNYYPTDGIVFPSNSFTFMDLLREQVLNKRIPFQNAVLIYPMRSKDYTYISESTFDSYEYAYIELIKRHIPFRILPLETMTDSDLININNVVLAGAESISDTEYDLLKNKTISLIGENGTKDKWGNERLQPLVFPKVSDILNLRQNLDFTLQAPPTSYVEYYIDKSNKSRYFIFVYNDEKKGQIIIHNSSPITGKVYEIDNGSVYISGSIITIPIVDYLEVIEVQLSNMTEVSELNDYDRSEINLGSYPNPFNLTTIINYTLKTDSYVSLKIFDITGKEIRALTTNEFKKKGQHIAVWDGKNKYGIKVSSGLYFYKLRLNELSWIKKIVLLK